MLNNRITLKLKYGDEYIIKEMFNKFSSGYKIGNDKNSRYMSLSSTKMVCTLKKLGCVENKTEVGFDLPNISKDLFRHFVRGYFDGDGSVGIRSKRHNQIQVSICSIDNKFLTQLQEKLREALNKRDSNTLEEMASIAGTVEELLLSFIQCPHVQVKVPQWRPTKTKCRNLV